MSLRQVLSLALPALGVLAATPLYLLLDTAVVGRLGGFELAALAAASAVYSQVTTQLTFLSYGTTARAARLYGMGRRSDAVAEGVQSTWVAVGVGLVLAALVGGFAGPIGRFMAADDEVGAASASWLRIAALGIPLVLITMAGNGWLRGLSNTRWPLYFTLAGVVPGAILVPILVNRLGLVGSAIATVTGTAITAACFLAALAREHEGSWRPRWSVIRRQLVLGRDLIVRSLSFQVAFLSAAFVAARWGQAALAAHQIMLQLWNFVSLVLDALAIAAQALTGAALGRGTARPARRVGSLVTGYSVAVAAVIAAVFALGAGLIPQIFTPDEAVHDALSGPWWVLVAMIVAGGVVFALDGVLIGAADAAFLRNVTIASVVLGFLPGVWLAYFFDGGLVGVWSGLLVFVLIRLVAGVWRFRSMRWAENQVD